VSVPEKTLELLKVASAQLAAIVNNETTIDTSDPVKLSEVNQQLYVALKGVSEIAQLHCNGKLCPEGMRCESGTCVPSPA
jgi:hypothetical protein